MLIPKTVEIIMAVLAALAAFVYHCPESFVANIDEPEFIDPWQKRLNWHDNIIARARVKKATSPKALAHNGWSLD